MAHPYNRTVPDVPKAFDAVPKNGKSHKYDGEPNVADMTGSHIQGVGAYKSYLLLPHNDVTNSRGMLLIVNRKKQKLVTNMTTPNYNHPGGCQVIGDFLAVAIESGDYSKSRIRFYNLEGMTDSDDPKLLDTPNIYSDVGADGVGITNYRDSAGKEIYALAVIDNGRLTTYRSNGEPLGSDNIEFTKVTNRQVLPDGYSEVTLVTDDKQELWLIGFRSEEEGASSAPVGYDDYVDLYPIDKADLSAGDRLKSRHMVTTGPLVGVGGVHFRWGGGLQIRGDGTLEFYAMQRNFVGGNTYSNTFLKD